MNLLKIIWHWLRRPRVWTYEFVGGPHDGAEVICNQPLAGTYDRDTEHATHVYWVRGNRLQWVGSCALWDQMRQLQ